MSCSRKLHARGKCEWIREEPLEKRAAYGIGADAVIEKITPQENLELLHKFCDIINYGKHEKIYMVGRIGAGSLGNIYLAVKGKALEAVKIFANPAKPEILMERLAYAVKLHNRHPEFFLEIKEYNNLSGLFYIRMEYLQEGNLQKWIARCPQPDVKRILAYMRIIAEIVEALHEEGLKYRDLRPDNLMLAKNGSVLKLIDYESMKKEEDTFQSVVIKSPYQAPEEVSSQKSDIFSLGVIFYQLLTHKTPQDDNLTQCFGAWEFQEIYDKLTGQYRVSKRIAWLIADILGASPEKRPVSSRVRKEITYLSYHDALEYKIRFPDSEAVLWKNVVTGVQSLTKNSNFRLVSLVPENVLVNDDCEPKKIGNFDYQDEKCVPWYGYDSANPPQETAEPGEMTQTSVIVALWRLLTKIFQPGRYAKAVEQFNRMTPGHWGSLEDIKALPDNYRPWDGLEEFWGGFIEFLNQLRELQKLQEHLQKRAYIYYIYLGIDGASRWGQVHIAGHGQVCHWTWGDLVGWTAFADFLADFRKAHHARFEVSTACMEMAQPQTSLFFQQNAKELDKNLQELTDAIQNHDCLWLYLDCFNPDLSMVQRHTAAQEIRDYLYGVPEAELWRRCFFSQWGPFYDAEKFSGDLFPEILGLSALWGDYHGDKDHGVIPRQTWQAIEEFCAFWDSSHALSKYLKEYPKLADASAEELHVLGFHKFIFYFWQQRETAQKIWILICKKAFTSRNPELWNQCRQKVRTIPCYLDTWPELPEQVSGLASQADNTKIIFIPNALDGIWFSARLYNEKGRLVHVVYEEADAKTVRQWQGLEALHKIQVVAKQGCFYVFAGEKELERSLCYAVEEQGLEKTWETILQKLPSDLLDDLQRCFDIRYNLTQRKENWRSLISQIHKDERWELLPGLLALYGSGYGPHVDWQNFCSELQSPIVKTWDDFGRQTYKNKLTEEQLNLLLRHPSSLTSQAVREILPEEPLEPKMVRAVQWAWTACNKIRIYRESKGDLESLPVFPVDEPGQSGSKRREKAQSPELQEKIKVTTQGIKRFTEKRKPEPGETDYVHEYFDSLTQLTFMRIPAGNFYAGRKGNATERFLLEYWIAKTPVTLGHFYLFWEANTETQLRQIFSAAYEFAAEEFAQAIKNSETGRLRLPFVPLAEFQKTLVFYHYHFFWLGIESQEFALTSESQQYFQNIEEYCDAILQRPMWLTFLRQKPEVYGSYPATGISWLEALSYCLWAGFTLPTVEQWGKAARGGLYLDGDANRMRANPNPTRKYPWGDTWGLDNIPTNLDVSEVAQCPSGASPYGCLDMCGLVWHWCLDRIGQSKIMRACCGSSWQSDRETPSISEIGNPADGYFPTARARTIGFRPVVNCKR